MTEDAIVSLKEIKKSYDGVRTLDGIDLELRPGEALGLIGHNGAGKTTLMKIILGLIEPSAGKAKVFGMNPSGGLHGAVAQRWGFLPEAVNFSGAMSGLEALRFYARLKGSDVRKCPEQLASVGLTDAAHKRLKAYSKGMRQRLGLAQALLGKPELLLLDEPTTGLDPDFTRTFYRLIDERRQAGAAVILSSHALAELEPHVDRLLVLQQGKCIAQGDLSALRVQTGLPLRIRVSGDDGAVREKLADLADVQSNRINGRTVEFICPPEQKMALIELVCRTRGVEDLQIELPNLDRIYSHYSKQGNTGKAEGGTEQ
ncbi:MAG: ABC transporter ATP-binding protein [Rhodospirillaceae bacterium]|nr:ABC transporter ATP-binding protein [Rhodospirillaceae bacterium]